MYPCRKTILGDFGQVLHPCHLHTLEDLKALYADGEFVTLQKSYRSTHEIMTYAKAVCHQPNLPVFCPAGSIKDGNRKKNNNRDAEKDEFYP